MNLVFPEGADVRLWRRFVTWWTKPITVIVTTTRSPDWEGDAAKHRQDAGWGS